MQAPEVKVHLDHLFKSAGQVIVGMDDTLKQILVAILADSHAILEGYPGLAKTLAVRTIASLLDLKFSRIQHTPDLMPSDITGTYILEEKGHGQREFKFQQGPVFANLVLSDELNRSTPKTQSALLEAMQEKQVTVGNTTFKLDKPFFVLATQNPIEQEGVFPLPEAQSDRFLLKIKTGYPSYAEEMEIVNRYAEEAESVFLKPVLKKDHIAYLQKMAKQTPISNDLKKYVVDLIARTRQKKDLIQYGASPRASIGLVLAAKANALIYGRNYVSKEDVHKMAYPILRHRIILSFEAERNNMNEDDVITALLR